MKHRAAGRLARKRRQQVGSVFEAFKAVGKFVGDFVNAVTEGFVAFGEAFNATFRPEQTQADFVLTPPPIYQPAVMMTRPQDWAPRQRDILWPELRGRS
jgi:hypothetical protein